MAEQSRNHRRTARRGASLAGLFSDFLWMASAFWASRQRNHLFLLAAALIAVVGATAYAQIRLNAWNRPFYNALTRKDMPEFVGQLGVFAALAGVLLVLNVAQMWLNQRSKVVLREGLVHDLLNEWLAPMRAFRLSNSGAIGVNPDQRLEADAQHLTDLSTDLGVGLLQSTLLLLSFIGVLWVLSQGMFLSIGGATFGPPGYLVWCALVYAGAASFLSWLVGRPLIALNAEHYAREAELRFSLMRVNEEIEGIALYRGETDERERLDAVFETVLDVSRRIVGAVTRLTWVTAGYGWFTIIAPILAAAPGYFPAHELRRVDDGGRRLQSGAKLAALVRRQFLQSRIGAPRCCAWRVSAGRSRPWTSARPRAASIRRGGAPSIMIDDLHVASPAGSIMLSEAHLEQNRANASSSSANTAREKPCCSAPWSGFGPGEAAGSRARRARQSCSCRCTPMFRPAPSAGRRLPEPGRRLRRRRHRQSARRRRPRAPRTASRQGESLGPGFDRRRKAMPRLRPRRPAKAAMGRDQRCARRPRPDLARANRNDLLKRTGRHRRHQYRP